MYGLQRDCQWRVTLLRLAHNVVPYEILKYIDLSVMTHMSNVCDVFALSKLVFFFGSLQIT